MMSRDSEDFDPNATGSSKLGLFGVPNQEENSKVVILPVPWEVTTSYGQGTADAPMAILKASSQLDLFDINLGRAYEQGFFMRKPSYELVEMNESLSPLALELRAKLEEGLLLDKGDQHVLKQINDGCAQMCQFVHKESLAILANDQIAAVLGGDHSTPLGLIQAACERWRGEVGILHIDAHADLRKTYQGFQYSHASIMHNVMGLAKPPKALVQVGIRDFCEEEYDAIQADDRIHTFFDDLINNEFFNGRSWETVCKSILEPLPSLVHVSFDIDGLSPDLCPNTGTPVPGGLSFNQAQQLIKALVESGRKIVSFDLNEVSPGPDSEWDANVGARVLYKLCGWATASHKPTPVI